MELDLSVIIVNYNVKHFLEQCLNSVAVAIKDLQVEVFVVDNISIDGSVEMVKEKFPWVHLIENSENVGFSRANNQAIRISQGKYVLLLNPDTVVEEDTFVKTVKFMNDTPNCGGLGVKMIDGKGVFLPESKRGLPTPSVAFYKIFGLASLFPKSKKFGQYHLGFLPNDETNKIEILSGAFMMMRKEALDKVGLLDEAFFMYGEDIDLSHRIILGGYDNYYFPETSIIHYKGESTKKSSINYVFVFYNAMIIFAKKHFSQKNARLFSFLINIAIYIRASAAIFGRFLRKMFLPFLDLISIIIGFSLTSYIYETVKRRWESDFSLDFQKVEILLPSFTILLVISGYFFGSYDKPVKISSAIKGLSFGALLLLASYGLLPKEFQFSRIVIVLGSFLGLGMVVLNRVLLSSLKIEGYSLDDASKRRFLIIGEEVEKERIEPLLKQTTSVNFFGRFPHEEIIQGEDLKRGVLERISDYIYINRINEVIFSAKNLSTQKIIEIMSSLDLTRDIDFKIAQPDSMFLIGSNSIHTAGDLYILDLNSINGVANKRSKRVFDFVSSILILALFPVFWMLNRFRLVFIRNLFSVLFGKKSWVGYIPMPADLAKKVPQIKEGVLSCQKVEALDTRTALKINQIYAKDYSWTKDLNILLRSFTSLF
ncbi:MAG: glycosyltransferase [Flavobacteriales bacterium]|nr:glycosyltransferase [Flavobacteriales bacterium]